MENQSLFSITEQRLLLQLLERERAELPVEIHHCEVSDAKDYLRGRLHEIDKLIDKLKTNLQMQKTATGVASK